MDAWTDKKSENPGEKPFGSNGGGNGADAISPYLRRAYQEEREARGEAPEAAAAVTVREVWHPAIKSGPDDNLDDFTISAKPDLQVIADELWLRGSVMASS